MVDLSGLSNFFEGQKGICSVNDNAKMVLLAQLIDRVIHLDGDVAEVGVCGGGSAAHINKVVTKNKSEKLIHLFDTFEGIPYEDESSPATVGDFKPSEATIEAIFRYFERFPNVHIYKGLFNEQCHHVAERKFSFVHLDVDQALSYQQCLEFFYPRMVTGGIILMDEGFHHAYKGAVNTVKNFFQDKPENPVSHAHGTGSVTKV